MFLYDLICHLSCKCASRLFSWVYLSDACFLGPVYRRLRILTGWERSALPVWGHQSLWHHQATDQWVVRSGSLGPAPSQQVTQLFKGWQRAEACQFNFGRPRAPWATMDTKNESSMREREKNQLLLCCSCMFNSRHKFCASIFLPSLRSAWFLICQQRRTAKRIDSPLSFTIPSAMSVTSQNVVLMRVVIKVLRNICGNGLWLWLPNH